MVLQTSFTGDSGLSLDVVFDINAPVGRIWLRFPLTVLQFVMVTVYERRACMLHLTILSYHLWSCGLSTHTGSSGHMAGRDLEDLSHCDLWSDLAVLRAWCLPLNLQIMTDQVWIWKGGWLGILWSSGALLVMQCCDQVGCRRGITWQDEDLHRIICISGRFFTAYTVLSMKPLACR